jgi:hypothetical protein
VQKLYEDVGLLNIKIEEYEKRLSEKLKSEPSPLTSDELNAVSDYEQGHSLAVIRKRRQAEWNSHNAGHFQEVDALRMQLDQLRERRAELLAVVEEAACVTRLICEKKRDLHRQYIDAYYHGALKSHPLRETLPPALTIKFENLAERLYDEQHAAHAGTAIVGGEK